MAKIMKILITGAKGFVGKNLVWELKNQEFKDDDILQYDLDTKLSLLDEYTKTCDFVFHLAGVNRPKDDAEFMKGNFGFTTTLLDALIKNKNKAPVLITSSIQAANDNAYGRSKRAGEDAVFEYGKKHGVNVLVYRLQNLFGKWSRPNYNSAVATFCYNMSRGLPITVNGETTDVSLLYIDDLLEEFIKALDGKENRDGKFCTVDMHYKVTLGKIVSLLQNFKNSRRTMITPDMADGFTKKLYSTYLSYLEPTTFYYPLKMHQDERGFFAEAFKSESGGQVSVNVSKPGITKGNHWHHTKIEKFMVVKGKGFVRVKDINTNEIVNYEVSDERMTVVEVPPGYTHSLVNEGDTDMITIIWANELFDQKKPDTYPLEV